MDGRERLVRYEIFRFILEKCRPPTVQELVERTALPESDVNSSLQCLHDLHHLKLYEPGVPSLTPLAMVHPFSHLPTPYIVNSANKIWWANCAWCAFGLAAMLSPDEVTVKAMIPSSGDLLTTKVISGEITQVLNDGREIPLQNIHSVFSAPPSQWWKDVRFACSGIQLCTSKAEADGWHVKHAFPYGDIISLDQLWKLSKAWYSDKAAFTYDRKTPQEAAQLFKDIGLNEGYWTS